MFDTRRAHAVLKIKFLVKDMAVSLSFSRFFFSFVGTPVVSTDEFTESELSFGEFAHQPQFNQTNLISKMLHTHCIFFFSGNEGKNVAKA